MDASSYLTDEVRSYTVSGMEIHYDNYWNEVNNTKRRDIGVSNMRNIGITSLIQIISACKALFYQVSPINRNYRTIYIIRSTGGQK